MNLRSRLAANHFLKALIARLPFRTRRVVRSIGISIMNFSFRSGPQLEGVYQSFDALPNPVYPPDDGRREFIRIGLASVQQRDQANGLVVLRNEHNLLPIVAAALGDVKSILDFGGAGGLDFLGLLSSTDLDTRYCVVETPATCAAAREFWQDDERISFRHDLPATGERFDLVYAWGALHYVADPISLTVSFTCHNPKAILIVHSPFAPEGFVRAQHSPPGTNFPQWVISLPQLETAMAEAGYHLAYRAAGETAYNVDNFAGEYRVGSTATLLFVRRESDSQERN